MSEITVQYERKFSDGNYGSEGLSLSLTVNIDGDPTEYTFNDYTAMLRANVLWLLSNSAAEGVAWAAKNELNPPPPRQPVVAGRPAYDPDEAPF